MLTLLIIASLFHLQQQASQDTFVFNEGSAAEGHWESPVHESDLQGLPTWNPNFTDAPILSPAQAVRAAKDVMSQLSLNDTWPDRWTLGSVDLRPIRNDVWVYVVTFSEGPPPCDPPPGVGCGVSWATGPTSGMHIVVLPDGRAVTPILTKRR